MQCRYRTGFNIDSEQQQQSTKQAATISGMNMVGITVNAMFLPSTSAEEPAMRLF